MGLIEDIREDEIAKQNAVLAEYIADWKIADNQGYVKVALFNLSLGDYKTCEIRGVVKILKDNWVILDEPKCYGSKQGDPEPLEDISISGWMFVTAYTWETIKHLPLEAQEQFLTEKWCEETD